MGMMRAMSLIEPGPVTTPRLNGVDRAVPEPTDDGAARRMLLRVRACGVCHTDLHIVEGDLPLHRPHVVPGHQVVATVAAVPNDEHALKVGDRVGVPWLFSTCGVCEFCRRGQENLCDRA